MSDKKSPLVPPSPLAPSGPTILFGGEPTVAPLLTGEPKDADELPTPSGLRAIQTVYADSFFLTFWTDRMKISFAEIVDGEEVWRTAVMMPMRDAEILAKRLSEAVAESKKEKDE